MPDLPKTNSAEWWADSEFTVPWCHSCCCGWQYGQWQSSAPTETRLYALWSSSGKVHMVEHAHHWEATAGFIQLQPYFTQKVNYINICFQRVAYDVANSWHVHAIASVLHSTFSEHLFPPHRNYETQPDNNREELLNVKAAAEASTSVSEKSTDIVSFLVSQ